MTLISICFKFRQRDMRLIYQSTVLAVWVSIQILGKDMSKHPKRFFLGCLFFHRGK